MKLYIVKCYWFLMQFVETTPTSGNSFLTTLLYLEFILRKSLNNCQSVCSRSFISPKILILAPEFHRIADVSYLWIKGSNFFFFFPREVISVNTWLSSLRVLKKKKKKEV